MNTHHNSRRLLALRRALGAAFMLVVLVLAGCDSNDADSPDDSAREVVFEAANLASADLVIPPDIGTPSGVTLEPLARGTSPYPIEATFKFRYDRAMQVVRLPDISDVVTARLTIAEGGSVGWHRHPGSAIIVVQSGTFGIIEETDCVLRTYGPNGDDRSRTVAFHRGGGILDVGFNAGEGDVVAYVTFLGTPEGHGPTVPVPPEEAPCATTLSGATTSHSAMPDVL